MGPCAHAVTPKIITTGSKSLRVAIRHAPIASDLPGLNDIIVALRAKLFGERLVPVLGDLSKCRLNCSLVVGATGHQLTLFPVPIPFVAEPGVRHLIGGSLDL